MTTFLLIRHATCDHVGRHLAGRAPGVSLNEVGRAEARALADRTRGVPIEAVYTSPLERARETAEALCDGRAVAPAIAPELVEIDFGDWTGRSFAELESDPRWKLFNSARSSTRIPGGELAHEAQSRIVSWLERARHEHAGPIAVVSHADVIRLTVAHYLGVPIDFLPRFVIAPASVSVLELQDWGPCIRGLNLTGTPLRLS
ncbi:MAG TPA: histidine phosphatase family protein [Gemmatimonadaceae bacterium]|nr:histidine phosphatase family protein [Gemmatimonadaceae bacterium]